MTVLSEVQSKKQAFHLAPAVVYGALPVEFQQLQYFGSICGVSGGFVYRITVETSTIFFLKNVLASDRSLVMFDHVTSGGYAI